MTDPGFGSRARAIARLCVIFGVLVPFTVTLWVWQRIGLPGRDSFKRWSYWRINSLIGMKIERRGRPSRAAPTLFVANHVSYFDIPMLMALVDADFVAK